MKVILWNLRKTLLELFPTKKFRLVLIGLIVIAAFISVSELALAKIFTQIILHEDTIEKKQLILLLIGFFLFYGFTRAGQFAQRLYRLRVFDKAFKANANENEITTAQENWRWPLALELTNISSTLTQLAVILSFFFYLNWQFALIDLIITFVVLEIIGRLFAKQITAQRGFVKARKEKVNISNAIKVGTRIKSGEVGTLWAGFAMIFLLAALLYLNYIGELNAQNTVVIFFGLRMQNSGLSTISTGLMRFARAKTHGE
jgi:hypothetical protein